MKKGRDLLRSISKTLQNPTPLVLMDASERYCYSPKLRWNPEIEDYFVKAYGPLHFARISEALTRPSCYSCIRVNALKSTSDSVIEKLQKIIKDFGPGNGVEGTNSRETDVNGSSDTFEKKSSVANVNISKCEIPGLDYVVFVQGSGPHVIDYGYEPDKPPKEVLVSRKCAEAVLRGAQVFVPGVVACSAHVEEGEEVAVSVGIEQPLSDGGWGVGITRGWTLQGQQTDPYHSERNGLYIGQGRTMLSRAGMFRVPKGIAVDMTNRVFRLPSFHDVLPGEIFLQNLPSIVTAHALDPQKGERILDMCAAPGGKTTAIAILMKDEGEVVAVDRSHNKVLDIQKLAAELGLTCITTYKLDSLKAVCKVNGSSDTTTSHCTNNDNETSLKNSSMETSPENSVSSIAADILTVEITGTEKVNNEKANGKPYVSRAEIRKKERVMRNGPGRSHTLGVRVEKSKGFLPESFDRVLLDAPCSALGLRPRLFSGEETLESLRKHGKYQRKMFDQAVQLVRPGGVLVYSTCTINPGENEAVVRYALDTYKFLSLAPQHPRVGGPGLVGRCEFPDGYTEEWLRPGEEDLVQRFDPSGSLDTIGFFYSKVHRRLQIRMIFRLLPAIHDHQLVLDWDRSTRDWMGLVWSWFWNRDQRLILIGSVLV